MSKSKITISNTPKNKIESDKIFVKQIFSDYWFRIPDYQRSYVWGKDEIDDLIEDVTFASNNQADGEYFLGSLVLQKKTNTENKIDYIEFDVLDGQQRLTTLLLLISVIRDITKDSELIDACNNFIFQKEQKYKGVPERMRLAFEIRDDVAGFIDDFVKKNNGTNEKEELKRRTNKRMFLSQICLRQYYI